MSNVYHKKINNNSSIEEIQKIAKELLKTLIEKENIKLENKIGLKVHFGEKGNVTFIKPKCFEGMIEFLKNKNIDLSYIETNVLYKSPRTEKKTHIALAKEHDFTQLPIIIADGDIGEDYDEIQIDKKNFKKCMIGKEFSKFKQLLVISHFKGHGLAGFGGAIKQLAMGCAARGGKLSQHVNSIPLINPLQCKKCNVCVDNCPENAISINKLSAHIDKNKCIGCAARIAVCPHNAIHINWSSSLSKKFPERLAEYAFAAQKDKHNIYISFALDITKGCDCMGEVMKPIHSDLGIFISSDPVAIDKACLDVLKKVDGKTFHDKNTLVYAEKIGLGSTKYELIEIKNL